MFLISLNRIHRIEMKGLLPSVHKKLNNDDSDED